MPALPPRPIDVALPFGLSWASTLAQEEVRSAVRVGSNEVNQVYRLESDAGTLFLKIGPDLKREYEKLQWLEHRLPCPRPIGFTSQGETDALLLSAVEGEDLARMSRSLPPRVIVTRLVGALKCLHGSSTADWPFGGSGPVLVHGDACLPNFLYQSDRLSGYIDVGDMTLGKTEVDLAAAVWSLQYNLGPGHGLNFLREYGKEDADDEDVERLRLQYETRG